MGPSHGIESKKLREMALSFAGRTVEEIANNLGMTPGSLRARFSTDGYDVKIRKGVIEEIALPYDVVKHRDTANTEDVVELPTAELKTITQPENLPYKPPTVYRLSDTDFNEVQRGFRNRRGHHSSRSL